MQCIIEIISIGNELLIGQIGNTNAQWLARYITGLGGYVRRISVVGDNLDEISTILKDSITRHTTLIITTGGLGPTFDDMTIAAFSKMLKLPMSINDEALKMVKEKYHQNEVTTGQKIELTPARLKMATMPKNAKPLRNPTGLAPAMLLKAGNSRIVALPGVPIEMKAIFEDSLQPLIREMVGNVFISERKMKATGIMESTLAPLIDEAMRENPNVYIKSHPKISEAQPRIELHLMTTNDLKEVAEKRVEATAERLSKLILEHGGKIVAN